MDRKEASPVTLRGILTGNAARYCEATSIHGFAYWVAAPRLPEKFFWVVVTIAGFVCASLIVNEAVVNWMEQPGTTGIATFSKSVLTVNFPAVTFCNPDGYDAGEYTRAVFNNLAFAEASDVTGESKSKALRRAFGPFLEDLSSKLRKGFLYEYLGKVLSLNTSNNYLREKDTAVHNSLKSLQFARIYKSTYKPRMEAYYTDMFKGIDRRDDLEKIVGWKSVIEESVDPSSKAIIGKKHNLVQSAGWLKPLKDLFDNGKASENFAAMHKCLQDKTPGAWTLGHVISSGCFKKHSSWSLNWRILTPGVIGSKVSKHEVDRSQGIYHREILIYAFRNDKYDFRKGNFGWEVFFKYLAGPWQNTDKMCWIYQCTVDEVDRKVVELKRELLFSLFISPWPVEDLGILLDSLHDRTNMGVSNQTFRLYAKTVFGKEPNLSPALALNATNGYPLPAELANLLDLSETPIRSSDANIKLHPSMIDGIAPENILKLQKFSIWTEYQTKIGGKKLEKVLSDELAMYKVFARKNALKVPAFRGPHILMNNLSPEYKNSMAYSMTDLGICTILNGNEFKSTFKITDPAMEPITNMLDARDSKSDREPVKILGSGKMYRTEFWLNVRRGTDQGRSQGQASIAINNWMDHFSVRGNPLTIEGGHSYSLKLHSTVHTASEGFRAIALEKRRCRFPKEVDDESKTMFKYYSRKACLFECILQDVVNETNCLPWDYLPPPGMDRAKFPLCNAYNDGTTSCNNSRLQFEHAMDNSSFYKSCSEQCLPNCEESDYDFQVDTTKFNLERMCQDPTLRMMARDLWMSSGNLLTWLDEQSLTSSPIMISSTDVDLDYGIETGLADEICKSTLEKNVARVTIEVAKPTVLGVEKRRSATFADQLGTVGGTVGLFTGLSLISVIEALYWVYLTVVSYLSGSGKRESKN